MSADDQNIGRLVAGRYRLDAILGRGGFGSVYRGWDTEIGRDVAVKLLDVTSSARTDVQLGELRERFRREAMAAGRINHPSVVTIYDFGIPEDGSEAFLVMELLQGHDLAYELDNKGPLTPDRALRLFVPLLEAIGRGHEMGIVHKDIKPQNIFLRDPDATSESLCVVDFGVARVVHEDKLTVTGLLVGTPQYMAPEYITDTMVTPALDVYQLGLILAESITGVPAVPMDETFVKSCNRHFTGDLDIPDDLYRGPFGQVLKKALAPNPEERIPDATTFMTELSPIDPRTIVIDSAETQLFNRSDRRVSTYEEPPLFPPMNREQVSLQLEQQTSGASETSEPVLSQTRAPATPVSTKRPSTGAIHEEDVDPFGPTQMPQDDLSAVSVRERALDSQKESSAPAPRRQQRMTPRADVDSVQSPAGRGIPSAKLPGQLSGPDSDESWEWGEATVTVEESSPFEPEGRSSATWMLAAVGLLILLGGGGFFAYQQWGGSDASGDEPTNDAVEEKVAQKDEEAANDSAEDENAEPAVLVLNTTPEGAGVYAGQEKLGTTPAELTVAELEPSRLELRLEGYEPHVIAVQPGEQSIELQKKEEEKKAPKKRRKTPKEKKRQTRDKKPEAEPEEESPTVDTSNLVRVAEEGLRKQEEEAKAKTQTEESAEESAEENNADAATSDSPETSGDDEEEEDVAPTRWDSRKQNKIEAFK